MAEPNITRRNYMKYTGIGTAVVLSQTTGIAESQKKPRLAIDRTGIVYENRPMYLRAYHPPYVVYYYAALRDGAVKSQASIIKWMPIYERIEKEPELVVRIVEAYDDACAGCANLKADPMGSAWGVGYSCTTIKKPDVVKAVTLTCRRILGELGLYYGDEIKMRDLIPLLAANVPTLYEYIGGEANQEFYDKGLIYLGEKYAKV